MCCFPVHRVLPSFDPFRRGNHRRPLSHLAPSLQLLSSAFIVGAPTLPRPGGPSRPLPPPRRRPLPCGEPVPSVPLCRAVCTGLPGLCRGQGRRSLPRGAHVPGGRALVWRRPQLPAWARAGAVSAADPQPPRRAPVPSPGARLQVPSVQARRPPWPPLIPGSLGGRPWALRPVTPGLSLPGLAGRGRGGCCALCDFLGALSASGLTAGLTACLPVVAALKSVVPAHVSPPRGLHPAPLSCSRAGAVPLCVLTWAGRRLPSPTTLRPQAGAALTSLSLPETQRLLPRPWGSPW